MKKVSSNPNGNIFTTIVRTVVKEELIPVKEELVQVEKRLNRRMDLKFEEFKEEIIGMFREFRNDIATMKNEIMGELKTVREEQIILSSQHSRVVDLEDKVENLEKIHPQGQHAAV